MADDAAQRPSLKRQRAMCRYGKSYMGMERSTFVLDADGTVVKIMRKVKPADHADDVLAALNTP